MRNRICRAVAALALLAAPLLSGCDDTALAATQNGVITASTSLLAAVLRAATNVGLDAANQQ
jgi:hypothetical protein